VYIYTSFLRQYTLHNNVFMTLDTLAILFLPPYPPALIFAFFITIYGHIFAHISIVYHPCIYVDNLHL